MLVEGRHRARIFLRAGEPPPGFKPSPASLEDFYLALMLGGLRDSAVPQALAGGAAR
jgi:hypothetical protein